MLNDVDPLILSCWKVDRARLAPALRPIDIYLNDIYPH